MPMPWRRGWASQNVAARAPQPAGGTPATFVGAAAKHLASGATNTTWSSLSLSPTTGDMVIVMLTTGVAPSTAITGASGVAYTRLDSNPDNIGAAYYELWYKILVSGESSIDINTTDAGNTTCFAVYRGPTTATRKDVETPTPPANPAMAGFTPNVASKGVVFLAFENKDGVTPGDMQDAPTGGSLAVRLKARPWATCAYISDKLSGYANATTTLYGFNDTTKTKIAWEVELT